MKTAKDKQQGNRPRWLWIVAAIAFFLVLEAYWPAVHGPFVFDDEYLAFRDPGFVENGLANLTLTQRPLMNATFWLNAAVSGTEDSFPYHLFNIICHSINGILLFLAIRKLLVLAKIPDCDVFAAFAAAVFLFHPVQTESVAYVSGRSESLSLLFFLSAFTVFLYRRNGGIAWGPAVAVIVLFGAAFLTKEHTAVLPGLLLLTDLFWSEKPGLDQVKRNWRLYGPLALMAVAGGLFVAQVLRTATTAGFAIKGLPWYDYFYTQWRAVWIYLRLFIAPVGLNADYAFPISRSPLDQGALFGLLGLLAVTGLAWFYRKKFPLAFYGWLVFLLLLAPTSSFVPIKDAVAERRLYLPLIGLLAIMCDLLRRWRPNPVVLTAVALTLAYLTYARSAVWGDPVKLWTDTAEKSPHNSRAHFQLAMAYYQNGQCADALRHFADAERAGSPDYALYLDWGLALDCAGNQPEAKIKLEQAVKLENTAHAHSLIGMVLAKQKRLDDALAELEIAAKLEPGYDMTYFYRGNVHLLQGDRELAKQDFQKTLSLNPANEAAQRALSALGGR